MQIFIISSEDIEYLYELFIIISDNVALRRVKSPRVRDSVTSEGSESLIDRDRRRFPRVEPLYV